ncbi:MAG TPA: hypothetical protein VK457_15590 [Chloroflexota bacterium]|nr:hypothetical protein [Chloroflexota bacterium]
MRVAHEELVEAELVGQLGQPDQLRRWRYGEEGDAEAQVPSP